MVSFRLNGEIVDVPSDALHLSAASFIRQRTQCKSIKVSCNEGGCGACAVELVPPHGAGGKDGVGSVLAVNSCLLPVAALDGCQLLTSEGLGNSRSGFHEVQERLAAFHGTQCGFCSPGITVATHAALLAAAHKQGQAHKEAAPSCSSSSSGSSTEGACNGLPNGTASSDSHHGQCNGVAAAAATNGAGCAHQETPAACKGSGRCRSQQAAAAAEGGGGVTRVTSAQLLGALDGNLCRCTGWRPIADCAKSFACDVDIEDLGLHSLSKPPTLLTHDQLTPAALRDTLPQSQQQQPQQQQEAGFLRSLRQLQLGSILAPSSMAQLLQALAAAGEAQLPVHLLGGNTGAGLYKEQWGRLGSSVVVLVRGVRELQQLEVLQPGAAAAGGAAAGGGSAADSSSIDCFAGAAANGSSISAGVKAAGAGKATNSTPSSSRGGDAGSPVLVAGAAVTISRLIEALQDTLEDLQPNPPHSAAVTPGAQQQQQQQGVSNLQYMVCHLRRVAGTLVRNAATLGGHLALVRGRHLESDLATLLTAAGAKVCVTAADGCSRWMDLAAFCNTGQQQQQQQQQQQEDARVLQLLDRQQAVITAVQFTLPVAATTTSSSGGCNGGSSSSSSSSSVRFWSHKLTTHRQCNEHAAVNASIWLSGPHPDSTHNNNTNNKPNSNSNSNNSNSNSNNSSSADTTGVTTQHTTDGPAAAAAGAAVGTAGRYRLRIAVGTYQQQQGGGHTAGGAANGLHSTADEGQQQGQAAQQQQEGVWQCRRAFALEAALLEALQQQQQGKGCGVLAVLGRLPELLQQDIQPGGRMAGYVRRVLPGLLLKGLAAVLPPHMLDQHTSCSSNGDVTGSSSSSISAALLAELRVCAGQELAAAAAGPAGYQGGRQDLPIDLTTAPPLYWPTERDGGRLQASGEAVYADDVPILPGALHAAYVTSTRPHATLLEVDWSQALTVPGVVGWVSPQDIPAGPAAKVLEAWAGDPQPLFAHTTVSFVGQALGLVLAHSPEAAQAGAKRVAVKYGPASSSSSISSDAAAASDSSTSSSSWDAGQNGLGGVAAAAGGSSGSGASGGALTSLSSAVAAGSWHSLEKFKGSDSASTGDVSAALASAARVVSGRVVAGSQRHGYMEPQVAVVTPEEGGRMTVVSSCQGCDMVMYGVCRVLQLRHNEVHVTSRRVGGGFGGKASASVFHAAAAAVAAHKFRRQVRLVVPQAVDVSLNAGRCPMVLDWRAGLDEGGRLQALDLALTLMDGAFAGGVVEAASMKGVADSVYAVPHLAFSLRLAKTHMPPRSTVRGPGKVSMIILLELALQQLAAAAGAEPDAFRRQHMLALPPEALAAAAQAEAAAAAAEAPEGPDQNGVASPDVQQQQQQLVLEVPHPKYLPKSDSGSSSSKDTSSSSSGLRTALGQVIELRQYTLPYMMAHVAAASSYGARRKAAAAFNAAHTTRKRGLALVPVRYPLFRSFYTGRVTIYCDGSVLLSHAGVEIGQGISSKVKQTAAAVLGSLLPPEARGDLLPLIRVAGGSTELSPHAGLAAGSTTSEGATAAIAAACEELVGRLQASADALREGGQAVTWEGVVKGVCGWEVLTTKVLLTASARGGLHDESASPMMQYQSFGVGAAEVEVDCLTGERTLLRADIMFDAGSSVSPAIDMGQIEGAFMNGVGYVMSEEVIEDEASGANLTNSTWTYKPPGIAELPQVFNVSMLRDSPCHVLQRQQLSAKATGEPPLMMAAAVAAALQDACHAAWRAYEKQQRGCGQQVQGPEAWPALELPATTAHLLAALPPLL